MYCIDKICGRIIPGFFFSVTFYIINTFLTNIFNKTLDMAPRGPWRYNVQEKNVHKNKTSIRTSCHYGHFFHGCFAVTYLLSPRTFCHHRRFVATDVLSLRTFFSPEVLSSGRFGTDVLSPYVFLVNLQNHCTKQRILKFYLRRKGKRTFSKRVTKLVLWKKKFTLVTRGNGLSTVI